MYKNINDKLQQSDQGFQGGINGSLSSFENGDSNVYIDAEGHEYINLSAEDAKKGEQPTDALLKKTDSCIASLRAISNLYPVKLHAKGASFSLFFHKRNPEKYSELKEYDTENAAWFYRVLLKEGVRFNPQPDGLNVISEAHTDKQLRLVIIAVQRALSFVYGYVENM